MAQTKTRKPKLKITIEFSDRVNKSYMSTGNYVLKI